MINGRATGIVFNRFKSSQSILFYIKDSHSYSH